MPKFIAGTVFCVTAVAVAGCHRYDNPSSRIAVANPAATKQLLFGFYPPENGSFRWVTRNFAVALKPPEHIGPDGGRLVLHLFLPANEMRMLAQVTLTASADGRTLGQQTWSKAGEYEFDAPVEPVLLDTNVLPVSFRFDKAMQPRADGRELAAVVTDVALVAGRGK